MLPILDRSCQCGTGQTLIIQDQNGNTYAVQGNIVTVPDYGEHPTLILTSAPGSDASPITITQPDPEEPWRRVIGWGATQSGRKLLAPNGTTVLYEAPPEQNLIINGAGSGAPTIVGGLRVTPSGELNHQPTISLAMDPTNPPSGWHVNDQGLIQDGPAA